MEIGTSHGRQSTIGKTKEKREQTCDHQQAQKRKCRYFPSRTPSAFHFWSTLPRLSLMTAFFLPSQHFHPLSLSLQSSLPCTAVFLPACSVPVSGKLRWLAPPGYCSRCKVVRPGERRSAGRLRSVERYSGESGALADWRAGFMTGSVTRAAAGGLATTTIHVP